MGSLSYLLGFLHRLPLLASLSLVQPFALTGFLSSLSLENHASPSTAVNGVKARLWRTRVSEQEKIVSAWLILSRWGGWTCG
ncbi:hypothetical protein BDR03DRAFT_948867 [Suillus americanus]|nr:hypothetical protein BDR03DRAFT_948867 [Suillus americanus]